MLALVAIWAFAEAVLFFVVADVPIMALAARRGVRAGLTAACIAALGAGLGGAITWLWGGMDPGGFERAMVALPGVDAGLLEEVRAEWREDGFLAMLAGSFGGTPFKLYAGAAGFAGSTGLPLFILLSIITRLPRFMLVGVAGGWLGPKLRARLGERRFWALFVAAWCGFYLWYWSVMGG